MTESALRHRPVYGGPFGRSGRYLLASLPRIEKGLHAVRFLVTDLSTGAVLSIAEGKREALAAARAALHVVEQAEMQLVREAGFPTEQGWLWPEDALPVTPRVGRRKPVSKRRRVIFEKGSGPVPLLRHSPDAGRPVARRAHAAARTWWRGRPVEPRRGVCTLQPGQARPNCAGICHRPDNPAMTY